MARPIRSIDIYLPLDYNDGRAIPDAKYISLQEELLYRFGGVVADGVQRSHKAFLKALPHLLTKDDHRGSWVAFHGEQLIAIGPSETSLYQKCLQLGLAHDSFFVGWIEPNAADVVDVVDPSLFEFDEH